LPPESFLSWYGDNASLLFDFFAPLEIASAVVVLAAAVLDRLRHRTVNLWLVASAVLAVAVLVTFPLYFQAANGSFATRTIPVDRVGDELARWAAWHWMRTAIGLVAFIAAIVGSARLPTRDRGR
jgi:hypothetical protein